MSTFGVSWQENARQRPKAKSGTSKRVALSVIDHNVNKLKNVTVDPNVKLQTLQSFGTSNKTFSQCTFQIHEDQENIDNKLVQYPTKNISLEPPSSKVFGELSNFKIHEDENDKPIPNNKKRLSVFQELTLSSVDENKSISLDDSLDFIAIRTAESLLEDEKSKNPLDVVLSTPYREDIFSYFKDREKKFLPKANYMNKQTDITMNMRCVLVDWLVEVGEEYKLEQETLYLAVSYVDRFLSHMSVFREKLQLVGTASMFLATKYEEIYPPELKDFVYITDDTYTKKQILKMEHLLLKVLNFEISAPTAYSFLKFYCSVSRASQATVNLAEYICELSLLDGDPFLAFTPSTIAGAALSLANFIQGQDMWSTGLEHFSGYSLLDFTDIIPALYNKYSMMPSSKQQSVFEKYKSPKWGSVSTMQLPNRLPFPLEKDMD